MGLRERSTTALYTFVNACFRIYEGRQLRFKMGLPNASARLWQISPVRIEPQSRSPHTVDRTSWILDESAESFELASGWQLCVNPVSAACSFTSSV